MPDATAPLILPQLAGFYAAVSPWGTALLRAVAGLALIPHGLRAFFGFFPQSGSKILSPSLLAGQLERSGYRPGMFWVVIVALTEFGAGPLLALGLFTRPAALVIFVFMAGATIDHARSDGYFWNTLGLEYPLMWSVIALFFMVQGGGSLSLDHLLLGRQF